MRGPDAPPSQPAWGASLPTRGMWANFFFFSVAVRSRSFLEGRFPSQPGPSVSLHPTPVPLSTPTPILEGCTPTERRLVVEQRSSLADPRGVPQPICFNSPPYVSGCTFEPTGMRTAKLRFQSPQKLGAKRAEEMRVSWTGG